MAPMLSRSAVCSWSLIFNLFLKFSLPTKAAPWPHFSSQMFREMIARAVDYKQNPSDFMDEVLQELEVVP